MKEFLNAAELATLRKQHRAEKDGRTRDRIKAILLSHKGWTYKAIAEALLLDEETISRHVLEYKEKQKLCLAVGGSQSKLNCEQTEILISHLEGHTYTKIQDICQYVQKTYGIFYTVSGMTSWMHSHGFSYKKPKGVPAKADPVKQAAFIRYYEDLQKKVPEEEVIMFGDGVHPTMATKLSYGWIKVGQNKLIPTVASRTRLNLMGALNLENMDVTVSSHETLNSLALEAHFKLLRDKYPKASKIHYILDQGPYNKSKETLKAAQRMGIILHFLPPYSPNLNPIERLWKVMNEYSRNNRYFKTAEEFRREIFHFFEVTWPQISSQMVDRINDSFSPIKSIVSV